VGEVTDNTPECLRRLASQAIGMNSSIRSTPLP
jgi:hypothetical protein